MYNIVDHVGKSLGINTLSITDNYIICDDGSIHLPTENKTLSLLLSDSMMSIVKEILSSKRYSLGLSDWSYIYRHTSLNRDSKLNGVVSYDLSPIKDYSCLNICKPYIERIYKQEGLVYSECIRLETYFSDSRYFRVVDIALKNAMVDSIKKFRIPQMVMHSINGVDYLRWVEVDISKNI